MLIVYYSLTGNVRRFTEKLKNNGFPILEMYKDLEVNEDYILITNTYGFGKVPDKVEEFLSENSEHIKGVVSSGNRNFGKNLFAGSGDIISEKYQIPLLMKIENSGFPNDVDLFIERVHELYGNMD